METIFMYTENSKTSESHRFKLDLTDKLNLKNPNKNMFLANLSIYNLSVFKIKTGYKLELLTPETMTLLGSVKKDAGQDKDGEVYQN